MRYLLLVTLGLLLFPAMGEAQEGEEQPRGQGYVFFAPGKGYPGGTGTLHFGGGGERVLYKGLAVGGDIGYLFFPEGGFGAGIGLLSASGSYDFRNIQSFKKLVPFVTAGYSLAFRSGTANLFQFGGGVTNWFTDRIWFRLEFRDTVAPNFCGCGTGHMLQLRAGFTFR
ncbi:MAG: hypothetical protein O6826_08640 [Acidobacteria bacterium]|nr:hypothetical protein [Acidobacteriota bacterium]